MATNTPNLNLVKPGLADNVDITELNGNMDIIDGLGIEDLASSDITSPVSGDSLVYDGTNWVNGPRSHNAIINGDFGIWQRGTSFTSNGYTADRWLVNRSGATGTATREAFTPADIETIGYGDAEYYLRLDITGADDFVSVRQPIEDVRTFAGQEVTLSFWCKSDATSLISTLDQIFGSGGSADVRLEETFTPTTSWVRYSFTFNLGSMSGKTIGTNSYLYFLLRNPNNETFTLDIWGVQLEAGPVATPFKLAGGGSKAAELALCQRYYYLLTSGSQKAFANGTMFRSNVLLGAVTFPTAMRITPSIDATDSTGAYNFVGDQEVINFDSLDFTRGTSFGGRLENTTDVSGTQGSSGTIETVSGGSTFVAFDAEL